MVKGELVVESRLRVSFCDIALASELLIDNCDNFVDREIMLSKA